MKNRFNKLILATLLAILGLSLTGCLNKAADQSSIPWSRPASWENQVPGFQ
ncbi:MAG: hypothetical protein MI748_04255 [Opitutales bacterium]|nr:hypothetical protein [Opitutales bacterium]